MPLAQEKTVLVVDDEPDVRGFLAQVLMDAGFRVRTAGDGDEALEMIRSEPPDFISLDLVMPRKSGHRLLYELRKDHRLSRIPVLIVTAHARDELGRGDLEEIVGDRVLAGPGVYLEKPVKPVDYVRCVQQALGVEESPEHEDRLALQDQVKNALSGADAHALRRALEALRKRESPEGSSRGPTDR